MVALTAGLARGLARIALLALLGAAALAAAQPQASEATVKAAYLYRFTSYVEWPPAAFTSPDMPFTIAVAASEDVAAELERLVANRTVGSRRVQVRRLREGDSLRGVHMLFVGRGDPAARALARAAQQNMVLLVTEGERGLDSGSSVNLVLADDRIGFEVSLDAAERSGLKISSRMLNVARRVVQKGAST